MLEVSRWVEESNTNLVDSLFSLSLSLSSEIWCSEIGRQSITSHFQMEFKQFWNRLNWWCLLYDDWNLHTHNICTPRTYFRMHRTNQIFKIIFQACESKTKNKHIRYFKNIQINHSEKNEKIHHLNIIIWYLIWLKKNCTIIADYT